MSLTDRIAQGLESGWNVTDSALLTQNLTAEADVVVIGTGAGGGTTAEILARSGLSVILVEEGRLYYQKDFKMDEQTSYANLYQEGMSRVTRDGAIAILQGRCVGGSTTVNWTSSFRTPAPTLNYWAEQFGLDELRPDAMAPWFDGREERHSMAPWQVDPNVNNDILRQGCEKLGYSWQIIPRNVKGCWNLGYCGVGCPTNAKQGALMTTIPGALDNNARLFHSLRADRLVMNEDKIDHLEASAFADDGVTPTGIKVTLKARHFVVAASAIGSPGLLLRSDIPDPHQRIGKRSFIHPVNATVAQMPQRVDPFYGAPQSIYSDEFNFRNGVDGPVVTNSRCHRCTRACPAASYPATAKPRSTTWPACPTCSPSSPCSGTASTPKAPAAQSPSATTAVRYWTTPSATTSGRASAKPSTPWPKSSSPPVPKKSA